MPSNNMPSKGRSLKAISLFSSAGIGELGIVRNDIDVVLSNELDERRHALYQTNFADTHCISGDICQKKAEILAWLEKNHPREDWFLAYATPPCQGMSTNGVGKLLNGVRSGERSPVDERNRLIIPAMDVITRLRPRWVLIENVPGMRNTLIHDDQGREINVLAYVAERLGPEYVGGGHVVACDDYGIPQLRKRLIAIFTRDRGGNAHYNRNGFTFFPDCEKKPRVTLREAIGHLPPLDARSGHEALRYFHPIHFVPLMNPEKYWCLQNTREGNTAFNNQCIECHFSENPKHREIKVNGISRPSADIPIYCARCGALLPRPSVIDKKTGERRLLKGFHSAYRRMKWDEPAPALTQNFIYEASDNKVHPEQTRVLSIYEALLIQTIVDYEYQFILKGSPISPAMFAEIIGESVPPRLIDHVVGMMKRVSALGAAQPTTNDKRAALSA